MSDTMPSQRAATLPGPEHHDTTEMPAVKVQSNVLDAVLAEVRALRTEAKESSQSLNERVDSLAGSVDSLANSVEVLQYDGKDTRLRIGRMERELDEVKDRQTNTSIRIREPSQHDLEAQAALAEAKIALIAEKEAREALAKEVAETKVMLAENNENTAAIKGALVGVIKNPKVIFVGKVIFALAAMYSAAKGIKVLP